MTMVDHGSSHAGKRQRLTRMERSQGVCQSVPRIGMTLIEMIVSLSTLSVLMLLTGATFHLLMRTERMASQSFVTERVISKLATDFRNDVHRAKSGTMPALDENLNRQLDLDLGDGTHVRYQAAQHRVTRLLVKGNNVTAREDFRLPDCEPHFLAESPATPALRCLSIDRPGSTITRDSQAPRPLRPIAIEAYLNRWPNPEAHVEPIPLRNGSIQSDGESQ